MNLHRSIAVAPLLLCVVFAGACQSASSRYEWDKRRRLTPPLPPDLDILRVTQVPPPADPPRQPPFDDTISAVTVPGQAVTVRFHADDRRLIPESYPQSDPLVIRSMLVLARAFGMNAEGRFRPLEINHVLQNPLRPGNAYYSSSGTSVVLTLTTPRRQAVIGNSNNQGNLEEVAIYDHPRATIPDATVGQIWTAYGHLVLRRISEDSNNVVTERRIKCYFLREDSNAAYPPMTEARLASKMEGALSAGYVLFENAVRAQDTPEEEVRIFTNNTTWP